MATTSDSERTNGGTIMLPQKRGWLDPARVSMAASLLEGMMHVRRGESQCASAYRSALWPRRSPLAVEVFWA
jgi:hypothetical protein